MSEVMRVEMAKCFVAKWLKCHIIYCYTLSRFPDSFNMWCTFTLIQNNKILVKIVNKQENILKLQSNDVIQYVKVVRCNEKRTIKVLKGESF